MDPWGLMTNGGLLFEWLPIIQMVLWKADKCCLSFKWGPVNCSLKQRTATHHANTRLVRYLDPHCFSIDSRWKDKIWFQNCTYVQPSSWAQIMAFVYLGSRGKADIFLPIGVNTNFSSILKETIWNQGKIGLAPSAEMRVPKTNKISKMREPKMPCMVNLGALGHRPGRTL